MSEPAKRDAAAPKSLQITVKDGNGGEWGMLVAAEKVFSSGSVGFYANGKIVNPVSGEKYQCGLNFTLIGSKPQ